MSQVKSVVDVNGVRYELTELIGRGGQGSVYAVKGGRLAVKLLKGRGPQHQERMRNQLTHVRRLPLGELPIAKPLEMLRQPHTGYVMELLTGMVPIRRLFSPPTGKAPNVEWYLRSGGLRRRLLLLGRVAHILSQLHGKGLAYSDPSPTNIFISEDPSCSEVWFIDTDNLRYESAPGPLAAVCTPGYGAPELVQGKSGVTTLTDAYAFSVIAFQVLTLAHPFIGDLVNGGEPELEEQAFSGRLPWIEDPEDTSNRASFGIPREWVLSSRLKEMFQKTFGEGRLAPSVRPGASEWAERLMAAADAILSCKSCGGSFYYDRPICPWCDTPRPAYAIADFHLWDPSVNGGGVITKPWQGSITPKVVARAVLTSSVALTITRRLAFGLMDLSAKEPVLRILINNNELSFNSMDGNQYQLDLHSGGTRVNFSGEPRKLRLGEGQTLLSLHFGEMSCLHRVLHLNLKRGKKQ